MYSRSLLLFLPMASAFNSYRSSLPECLHGANIPILLSSSDGWSQAIEPFNLRFTPTPNVVVIPRNVKDVQDALKCASHAKTRVTVKGGGHSYGASGLAGAMIMDMIKFQDVTLDSDTHIASVGAGVRLGNMASKLFTLGGRALPHGTCPSVGVGGHATLGGFGLDSRMWGLLVDTVTKLDVVLADGTTTTVSATSDADLFWALCGAGPGFAVVTTFYFKTLPAPTVNINWSHSYAFTSASTAASAMFFATGWATKYAPKELGFGIILAPANVFVVTGVYYGPMAVYERIIAPFLEKMKTLNNGQNPTSTVRQLGWIDSLTALAGGPLVMPPQGDNSHNTFYVKSIDTQESTPLSLAALTGLFTYLSTIPTPPQSAWFINTYLYGGSNSAITSFPPSTHVASTSSYAGRSSGYVWQLYGYTADTKPPFQESIVGFVKGMVDAFGPEAARLPAYAAYVDSELTREEAQVRYWGKGVPRLKAIKAAVDPGAVLFNPQGF